MSFEWHEHTSHDYDQQCALAIFQALKQCIDAQGQTRIHVSGGQSPIAFFEQLSFMILDWKKVDISLVDERIVEASHQESNTALVKRYLLQNHAKNARWVPLLPDPISDDISRLLQFAREHYMQPDVIVLGMGVDGHTASIFPDSMQFNEALQTQENILYTQTPSSPYARLSMSFLAITKTPIVFLCIRGKEKRDIFEKASLKKDARWPISYILHSTKVLCHVHYSE